MKEKLPFINNPSKNYFKPIWLLVSLLLLCNLLAAQSVEISGQVKDESGSVLPGVSINASVAGARGWPRRDTRTWPAT